MKYLIDTIALLIKSAIYNRNLDSINPAGSFPRVIAANFVTMKQPEQYSDEDLYNLNTMEPAELWKELHRRLKPEDHRLTHAEFCAFRGALIRNPGLAAAAGLDAEFPGLFQEVQYYLSDHSSKEYLCRQCGILPDYATVLKNCSSLNTEFNYNTYTGNDLDLVTGAVLADCEYCLTWLYELAIIRTEYVVYNERGWSLLAIAVKADSKNVIDLLIDNSGNEPGPLQPYRIWSDGRLGSSILKYSASTQCTSDDICFWSLIQWCDSFMEPGDPRVAAELDPLDRYKLGQMASVRVARQLKDFGVDLPQTASGPQGKNIWHAATVNQNSVFLTWLKLSYSEGINTCDNWNNTPLMYAIAQGKQACVEWFLSELTPAQIFCKGDASDPISSALDFASRAWNKDCVVILRCIYTHPAYGEIHEDIAAITKLISQIITSLVVQKRNIETRLGNGALNRTDRMNVWKQTREWGGAKCQILMETAPSSLFHSPAFQRCIAAAQKTGMGFLQYYLTNVPTTRKRLRSDGDFFMP